MTHFLSNINSQLNWDVSKTRRNGKVSAPYIFVLKIANELTRKTQDQHVSYNDVLKYLREKLYPARMSINELKIIFKNTI